MDKIKKGNGWINRIFLGLFFVLVILLVLIGGMFFVFGGKTLSIFSLILGGGMSEEGVGVGVGVNNNLDNMESGDSGGGGGSSGGIATTSDYSCSNWKSVHYSIGSFNKDIGCLVSGDVGCEKVRATCSVEIHNLNHEFGGVFSMKFSLINGTENIASKIINENIEGRGASTLESDFVVDGNFNIENLECVTSIVAIPKRCLD